MNVVARSISSALLFSLAAFAAAQAPIVRQPPANQQPDAQPPYAAPAPDQQQGPPQYQQPAIPQADQPAPAPVSPEQLDGLVNRIALYPDPLLAQVLTASTYWDEIPDASVWANEHSALKGDSLSAAITADNLPWDPSVLALLPFPSVLDMMAQDPNWTGQLGNAVLSQNADVMDSVQRLRREARGYGYLASNSDVDVIDQDGYVEIQPYNPYLYYVPIYDPFVVFGPPRAGFFVGGAIRFGPAVTLGVTFGRFGWFGAGFGWGAHTLLIDHRPWTRTFVNRGAYVHPYSHPYVRPAAPRVEHHPVQPSHGNSRGDDHGRH
jgi:hypothetical protein